MHKPTRGDAQQLQVRARQMAGGGLEATEQIARAHAELGSNRFHRNVLVEALLQQVFGPLYTLVGVRARKRRDPVAGLQAPRQADERRLGALERDLVAAELLD